MTITQRRNALLALLSAATGLFAGPALAQDYPTKPITIIVPFAAGGNTDVKTRLVALQLSTILGKPVIIDNKPGASGNIGIELLARAAPDGYTIGMGSFGPLAVNPSIYPKVNFDPKSFVPIVLLEKSPLVLATPADKPYKTVKDIVTAAKAKPGSLNIANAGPGGAHHLSAELFESAAGIDMVGVPFKGGGPASNALLAGQVDLMFEQTSAAVPSIQAGKIRPIAVTSAKRLASMPDVPTFAEAGYPQVLVSNWMGYIAPKGTPPAIVAKLHAAFVKAINHAEVKDRILAQGNEVGGGAPAEFASFIDSESAKWSKLVKERDIRID
ncbi:tripartite tricarboxylate transporter substrate binding protein [Variovorax sp. J22R133]|uniref:Bug family tripartite tricarboxylate transporter substrate binding protein n=1 Tax=Variovorax brevis TaxID=3053503 RepID=UPI00257599D1|nr:tripartite tricarboxylate transporter substrate binding protein [Variovorax sp. J22R133]MDM0112004.1 tripartite tricarboxylate transporter substrate binding protein [Variovorax sp. J22R133]